MDFKKEYSPAGDKKKAEDNRKEVLMDFKKEYSPAGDKKKAEDNRKETVEKLSVSGTLEQKDSNIEEIEATQTDPGPKRQPTEERIKAMMAEMVKRGIKEMVVPGYGYLKNEGVK